MNRERHQRLKELFLRAVEAQGGEREAMLSRCSARDRELADEVRELIELELSSPEEFLTTPAAAHMARAVALTPVAGEGEAEDDEVPFQGWERYTILKRIATGGMGEVYQAFDPRLKRYVALKIIRPSLRGQAARFLHEAEAQAKVAHDNVLEVFETGEIDGRLYIAMRFVEGPTLLGSRAETSLEEKVRIICRVVDGVHAAHRHGLVHRDIKPSNILMERTGDGTLKPYVMDFGIAASIEGPHLTATGEMLGTPWYMAPERVFGDAERLDRRADVYSLGVTMFEYFTGERPFVASGSLEMLAELRDAEPRSVRQVQQGFPADLETIVMKCLERDPQRRYPSARALAEELERYLNGEPIEARPTTITYRLLKKARRNRALVAVSTSAAIALVVMAGFSLHAQRQARVREQLAVEFASRVREIEFVMRMAHVAPLHDLRYEKQVVRDVMAGIRSRLEATGLLGEGSGHYALGRGYLALSEHWRAREHLERAWTRGFQAPEAAYSLGRVLGELYQEQLKAAEWLADEETRRARIAEIETELRQPALLYLRLGRTAGVESTEYVEALIAFHEGRYEEALERARQAYQRLPWLHEARKLEADIQAALGLEQWHRGNLAPAMTGWRAATSAYQAAAEVARSSADVQLGLCRLGRQMMELTPADDPQEVETFFELAVKGCSSALVADPDRAEAHRLSSSLYRARAEFLLGQGADPTSSIDGAIASARRALGLRPDEARSHLVLGEALAARGHSERNSSLDPRPHLAQAIDEFEKCLAITSRSVDAHAGIGLAHLEIASYLLDNAEDPSSELSAAIASLRSATAIDPGSVHAHSNLGAAYVLRARDEGVRGIDPVPTLGEAASAFRRTLEINPDYATGHTRLGETLLYRALHDLRNNRDPREWAEAAGESFRRALTVEAARLDALAGLAESHRVAARFVRDRGGDPSTLVTRGLEAVQAALAVAPGDRRLTQLRRELRQLALEASPP